MRKQTLIRFIFLAALLALMVPAVSAQGWPDYRNDDYYGRDRGYDPYGRNDDRYLGDTIRRLDRLAGDFQRDLDRSLDRSNENGTRHEDHLNADAREFRRAVRDLRNNFDYRGGSYGSQAAVHRVLDTAAHLEDEVEHHFDNQRLYSEWTAIQRELSVLSNAYGTQGENHGETYRRGRGDGDYRRDRNNNNDWWRRIRNWPN